MALLVSFEFNNTRKYMHSFDLMQLQTGCCRTKHTRVLMELSPIIAVTLFYSMQYYTGTMWYYVSRAEEGGEIVVPWALWMILTPCSIMQLTENSRPFV